MPLLKVHLAVCIHRVLARVIGNNKTSNKPQNGVRFLTVVKNQAFVFQLLEFDENSVALCELPGINLDSGNIAVAENHRDPFCLRQIFIFFL